MKVYNRNYGGFKRREAERLAHEKKKAEEDSKRAHEPKGSIASTMILVGALEAMAELDNAKMEEAYRARHAESGGW